MGKPQPARMDELEDGGRASGVQRSATARYLAPPAHEGDLTPLAERCCEGLHVASEPTDDHVRVPAHWRSRTLLGRPLPVAAAPPGGRCQVRSTRPVGGVDAIREVDRRELAHGVLSSAMDEARARGVRLAARASGGVVRVEPRAFRHALLQLVWNALRASSRGQTVTLSGASESGGSWWRVHDQGHGMSPPVLARLGRPPGARVQPGRGVGLLLAWAIIDQHDGLLHFASAAGEGTVASIWLPGS